MAEESTVDVKKWLADQQQFFTEFFDKYCGKENEPGQPRALLGL